MGLPLGTIPYYDNGGGLNVKYSPTKVPEDEASLSQNIDYSEDGAFLTRYGSAITNVSGTPPVPAQIAGAPKTLLLYDYRKSDGTNIEVIAAGTDLYTSLVTPTSVVSGLSGALPYPDMEFFVTPDDEYLIYGNGVDPNLKFDGTTWTNLSMPRPTPVTFGVDGAGVLPAGDYDYYVSFGRTVTGVLIQESELSPVATHTVALGPVSINLVVPVCTEFLLTGVTAQCNARVLYRRNNTSGEIVRLAIISDNVTTAYNDNTPDADLSEITADFDLITPPLSKVFEASGQRLVIADASNPTDVYASAPNRPWLVLESSLELFDGPVKCLKRVFNALMIGTDRSIWGNNGDYATTESRRISSSVGILNNRCAVEQDNGVLAILASNKKYFTLTATDFSQNEIRFTDPLSLKIDPIFATINDADPEVICMESYTAPSVNKVVISAPIGLATNNTLIIYNDSQAMIKGKPVWQIWNNINASALRQMTINGDIGLYSGDYNGFLWHLDYNILNGDGAEINGLVTSATSTTLTEVLISSTATSATSNTLVDSSLSMTVNAYSGDYISITGGTGSGQNRQILSNTATSFTVAPWGVTPDATSTFTVGQFVPNGYVGMNISIITGIGNNQTRLITANTNTTVTVSSAWATTPIATNEFTIGGYDTFHFSNWKYIIESYDMLKQLWFIWVNANASGDYTINLILQKDFDQTITNQTNLNLNLAALNSIWGFFIWGAAIWGAFSVFEDRLRNFQRFRSIRFGFRHRRAGQPFQINGFSVSAQNKKLFFRSDG